MESFGQFSRLVSLLGRPVGRFIVAFGGELARLGAVGEHAPDLTRTVARGFEDDMATIGRPARALVAAARVRSEIDDFLRRRIHDVNVVIAVGAPPTEGEELA